MNDPDYKLLWERDSTALGTVLNELSMARACNQDLKAANATLRNDLTAARLERDEARRKLNYRNREPPHCPTCGCGLHPRAD